MILFMREFGIFLKVIYLRFHILKLYFKLSKMFKWISIGSLIFKMFS